MSRKSPSLPPPSDARPLLGPGGDAALGLLSTHDEARAFWRVRWRIMATLARQTFAAAWFRLSKDQ